MSAQRIMLLRLGGALLASALLVGCGDDYGVRPVVTMDGVNMNVKDPVEGARAYLVSGQYGLAVETLGRLVQQEPGNPRAMTLLAVAYDRLHRSDLADRYYAAALTADPHFVAALNNWGYSHLLRRDYAEAARLLRLAAEVQGHDPIVEANLRLLDRTPEVPPSQATKPGSQPAPRIIPIAAHVSVDTHIVPLVRMAPGVQLLVTRPTPAVAPASGG